MVVALEGKKDWVIAYKILSQFENDRSEVNPIGNLVLKKTIFVLKKD